MKREVVRFGVSRVGRGDKRTKGPKSFAGKKGTGGRRQYPEWMGGEGGVTATAAYQTENTSRQDGTVPFSKAGTDRSIQISEAWTQGIHAKGLGRPLRKKGLQLTRLPARDDGKGDEGPIPT